MSPDRQTLPGRSPGLLLGLLLLSVSVSGWRPESACAQGGMLGGMPQPSGPISNQPDFESRLRSEGGPRYSPADGSQQLVTGVQVVGHEAVSLSKIQSLLRTRKDRLFDPDVVKAGRAWAAIASRMARLSGASGADASHLVAGGGKGGLLRYGQDITLVALAKKGLAASHYELPKGARPVDMGAAARDGEGSAADEAGQEAAQDAKDIGRAAKDEAKSTVTDGVRDGVRSAIGGLFQ